MFSIFKLIGGYCKVSIEGPGKERFLNLCKNKKILVWNLQPTKDGYGFYVSFKAYQMLDEIEKKSNIHVRIEGKYGLPFFLYRNKKRKMFFTGMILCSVLLYLLSLFVWDIQVKGTVQYTEDEIHNFLKDNQIHTGIWKNRIDCDALEDAIRDYFKEAAWVSCDIEGTLLTVHLKESINKNDLDKMEMDGCDIVASKDGVIESIITREGTPVVKKGMKVKQGDTLISGSIYYYNDFDELLETRKICADGDVTARTMHSYKESFPMTYYEKEYTGKITKEYKLYLHDFSLPSFGKRITDSSVDKVTEIFPIKVGRNFYLPISLQVTAYMEYIPKPVTLTDKEAGKKAEEKVNYYLKQQKEKGREVKKKDFKIEIIDGECMIHGQLEFLESIVKIRNIP